MRITVPRVSWQGVFAISIVALYLFGKMFYAAGQGGAQPADIAMVGAFLVLISPRAVVRLAGVNMFLLLLMLWAAAVNFGWSMATSNPEFITSMSYYLFNLGIVLAVLWTRQKNPRLFDLFMPVALLAALATQVTLTFFSGTYRSDGTFNNPNQLAFWALCCLSIWILVRRARISPLDLAVALGFCWVELCSLSRAGMGAMALLILIWLLRGVRTLRQRLIALGIAIFAAVLLALTPTVSAKLADSDLAAKAEARMNRQSQLSQFEYRGYDRIVEFAGHIVIGAGEGEKERFADTSRKHAIEIHSTFGTLLFSYGILGLTLFFAFLWRLTRTLSFDRYVYLAPSLAYGVTHNGLRFSFFWFMVGLLLSYAIIEGRRVAARRPVPAGPAPIYPTGAPLGARGPVGGR
jgi:hypothetical protein